jgi:hypothetical protein
MKIKFLVILGVIIFGIAGCSLGIGNDDTCYYCDTDMDCNEDELCTEYNVDPEDLAETSCKSIRKCRENTCKTRSVDCGDGRCVDLPFDSSITCVCNEGINTYKYQEYIEKSFALEVRMCLEDTYCETKEDCIGVFRLNDDNEFTFLPICLDYKCIPKE